MKEICWRDRNRETAHNKPLGDQNRLHNIEKNLQFPKFDTTEGILSRFFT